MTMRWGLGPVFACESILSARRWQVYASRSAFVLVLLVGMACVWIAYVYGGLIPKTRGQPAGFKAMAAVGEGFFYALTGIQVSLILLAAPAAAAGSLGMDRARGTLLQMMVTDLSDVEIVLGTLAARLAPVVGLIACAVPVTALAALLGGIDSGALAGALVVSLTLALLGCVLALTLSVWVTKLHEVLLAVYSAEAVWLVSAPIWAGLGATVGTAPPAWFWKANPYVLALAPYAQPGYAVVADFAYFSAAVLALSAGLLGLAIARLRRVVVEQSGRPAKAGQRGRLVSKKVFPTWVGPTLDGNPVLWREWHRNRPSLLTRVIAALALGLAWALAFWGTYYSITDGLDEGAGLLEGSLMIALTFGLLMISATAPTTLAEEHNQGSLDVLLATPLSTREIVVGKWWGVYRLVLVMLPLFLYVAIFEAAAAPDLPVFPFNARTYPTLVPLTDPVRFLAAICCPLDFLASGALLVSVGLALATWVRRLGRAVALSVIIFFLIGMLWPMFVEISSSLIIRRLVQPMTPEKWSKYHCFSDSLVSLSPIAGPLNPLHVFRWNQTSGAGRWVGQAVVIGVKTGAAGLLLVLSIRTFDRCLGRTPESAAGRARDESVVLEEISSTI